MIRNALEDNNHGYGENPQKPKQLTQMNVSRIRKAKISTTFAPKRSREKILICLRKCKLQL